MIFLILFLSIIICGGGIFLFYKFKLPQIKLQRENKEGLLVFKILYSEDMYGIWDEDTESLLVLRTIHNDNEISFIPIFDNTQSIYSLFDKKMNPWKSSYKVIKISRNKLIAEKISDLQLDMININGRFFIDINRFTTIEENFYKSIIEERISSNGIIIGEDIFNAIEGNYAYIELE